MSNAVKFQTVAEPSNGANDGTPNPRRIVTFAPNSQLFAQGTPGNAAYRLLSGKVELIRNTGLRKLQISELGPQAVAGHSSVVLGKNHFTSAVALENTQAEVLSAEDIQNELSTCPPGIQAMVRNQAEQQEKILQLADSPSVEQTFLGLCKGLEFVVPAGSPPQAESTVVAKLRDLFGLPSPVLHQVLGVLSDLNLLERQQKGALEATISVSNEKLMERARSLIDRWLHTLPEVLRKEAPREPYTLEGLAEELEVDGSVIVRRMMGADFPKAILLFDAKGVDSVLQVYGAGFFKQKVTSRDLIDNAQALEELVNIDLDMMKSFVSAFDFRRLCQLLTRAQDDVKAHVLAALPPRMRRIAKSEVEQMPPIADGTFADIESDFMELARESLSRR